PFSGYWRQGDKLYQAAVIPLAQDQDLVGFLLVALAVALLLSLLLARGILKPIGSMAQAAESAAAGDYRTRIGTGGGDALGRLARAFDSLLSDLREKSDMEGYVGHLTRYLPEPTAEAAAPAAPRVVTPEAPRRENAALLGVEFRHLLGTSEQMRPPALLVSDLAGVRALLATIAAAHGAGLSESGSARWLLLFDGERRLVDATRAWATIVQDSAVARIAPPSGALAESELVSIGDGHGGTMLRTVLGAAAAQVDRLLCDSAPGQLLMTRSAGDALKIAISADALAVATGAFSGKRYYALAPAVLPSLAADSATTIVRARPAASAAAADRGEIAPGTTLGGRYRVISTLGAGGMGVVYKAHDLELDDVVALKMLRPGILLDSEQLDRLKSEIKLARKITHPNVLRTFDFGEVDGRPYISMEYVRGLTLRYLLGETDRVPYSAALRIARPARRAAPGHTQPGMFIGTPNYCAPEQLTGDDVDERGDIYACGVVMSEMFCGGLPFTGANTMEIYEAQMRNEPIRPSKLWPEIPPELEAVILRCLRSDRQE
ncbi:MAG TPA: protein kinase, partial [Rhodanobacteraceae bacterium]|nr:protein kinase [Rhodanobacteraceae bacterium]